MAHNNFISPPSNFLSREHEAAVVIAKAKTRSALVKLVMDKSDAKREVAYGVISTPQLAMMFKLARKLSWPLLGLGTLAGIIGEILRANDVEGGKVKVIGADDVKRAIQVLEGPCGRLNALCREAIGHILCTLGMGQFAKPSPIARLFKKSKAPAADAERPTDLGTDAFLSRFDAGMNEFKNADTAELDQFYDEKRVTPTQGLFLVLSVRFLLYAVAEEIRASVVYVDELRRDGSLTKKRLIYPKWKVIRKTLSRLLHPKASEDVAEAGFGSEGNDIFTKNYTGRVNRNPPSRSCTFDGRNGDKARDDKPVCPWVLDWPRCYHGFPQIRGLAIRISSGVRDTRWHHTCLFGCELELFHRISWRMDHDHSHPRDESNHRSKYKRIDSAVFGYSWRRIIINGGVVHCRWPSPWRNCIFMGRSFPSYSPPQIVD